VGSGVINEKILPLLLKAAMDAKHQEYLRRLATIDDELVYHLVSVSLM
jgi:hypothetical protein